MKTKKGGLWNPAALQRLKTAKLLVTNRGIWVSRLARGGGLLRAIGRLEETDKLESRAKEIRGKQ